jgi:hypothetical protein
MCHVTAIKTNIITAVMGRTHQCQVASSVLFYHRFTNENVRQICLEIWIVIDTSIWAPLSEINRVRETKSIAQRYRINLAELPFNMLLFYLQLFRKYFSLPVPIQYK